MPGGEDLFFSAFFSPVSVFDFEHYRWYGFVSLNIIGGIDFLSLNITGGMGFQV